MTTDKELDEVLDDNLIVRGLNPKRHDKLTTDLIKWRDKAIVAELEKIHCCDNEPVNEATPLNVCNGKHLDRIKELSEVTK